MNDNLNFEQISTLWKVEKRNFVKQSTMSVYLLLLENHPYSGIWWNAVLSQKPQCKTL